MTQFQKKTYRGSLPEQSSTIYSPQAGIRQAQDQKRSLVSKETGEAINLLSAFRKNKPETVLIKRALWNLKTALEKLQAADLM